ncbi:mediator of RNA polymerase II transcription subunit 12 [Rhypophila decipiens]|uniref:Mediator of RNA polymerase II transcription subunit 12 n=1 Tax=Rhypophila decipiens TaxID=261697 RepID=A0AAN6YC48_9PEZI|nr:mediator of RNA polymerase II transcription subunit 12 [Rhypophila decipiens]
MTSRPPLGVQQRQPQRKVSGPGLSQRPPAHQRTLSQQYAQQYIPPSPIRKETTFHDYGSSDSGDGAQARYGTQRRGGSRLKLELSHDPADAIAPGSFSESPNAIESSKPFTPSRMMPMTDMSDLGDMSPHISTRAQTLDPDAPLPMPQRRQRFMAEGPRQKPTVVTPAPRKDTRPKPYTVEIPAAAPRYYMQLKAEGRASGVAGALGPPPSVGYADFFPWAGNHPEDQFSENAIRQGFYDKAAGQQETNTAKPTLVNALRHKNSLGALSHIFTNILDKRRQAGQITAPSSFRLPLRLMVTETKKEMWLKDVANPGISLRKQSRSIPHGIRGKVLLDQCLNKNMPTDRAVWLARCVGANELRAFRRSRGNAPISSTAIMGGEGKWIKDWTLSVEQFVETVIFGFEADEWKSKVNYAIRLATQLYAEYLLDREHYMEWLVSSFENSHQSKLPMWVLLIQIYWKDLLRLRKYGRRLVTALTSHYHLISNHVDKDILQPLISRLSALLNTLILCSPENFVSPTIWPKYRDTLRACLAPNDETRQKTLSVIGHRNDQLQASGNRSQPATRHILVSWLDRTLQVPMRDDMSKECWNISRDKTALVKALLEWCTSPYRPGLAKVYVTSRMLTQWSALGVDATTAVLEFLDTDPLDDQDRKRTLYHLVCELVRAGLFSVSLYVQWLMARGGLTDPRDVLPDGPGATRLLVELPTHCLTQSQLTLRAGQLRRASFSVADEARDEEFAINHVRLLLGFSVDPADPLCPRKAWQLSKLSKRIRISSRALKTEIGHWLRITLTSEAGQRIKEGNRGAEISPAMFHSVRALLEAAEDFAMLADILKALSNHANVDVLAAIADTINRHLFIFAALGAAKSLFASLHRRLRDVVQDQGPGARPLLASLASLAPRIPGMVDVAKQLKADLALSDRHNSVDVCSPVSDNMLQDDDSDLHEEIEKLLASGTSLDKPTMDRLFGTVVQRLQMYWTKLNDKQRIYSALLSRLRIFDAQNFDALMTKWLFYLRTNNNRPSILRIFPLLVSVGALSMSTILATTSETPVTTAAGNSRPPIVHMTYRTRYMQDILLLFMSPLKEDGLMSPDECYRFSIVQDQAMRENPKELLSLIRLALAEYSYARSQNESEVLPLNDQDTQARVLELIKRLVLKDATGVARALAVKSPDAHVSSWIDFMTTKLLIPTADTQTHVTFERVLELTNEFTLPFCQVKLLLSLSSNDQSGSDATGRQQSHVELFANAMDKAIDAKNISWTGMLSCLSPDITHHLKARAQSRFLEMLPSVRNPTPSDIPMDQNLQMAENLLSVIDAIIRGSPPNRQPLPPPAMAEKLADLWEILASADFDACMPVLNHWLPLLLTFITLHAPSLDGNKPSNEVRARILIVCAGMMQDLDALHGPDMDTRALSSRIFDLSCLFVDSLTEDFRMLCIRALKNTTADSRLRYIFSFQADPSDNLMLSHKDKTQLQRAAFGLAGGGLDPRQPGGGLGGGGQVPERLTVFQFRRWELLSESTPNIGENDTALSLLLFDARTL